MRCLLEVQWSTPVDHSMMNSKHMHAMLEDTLSKYTG
jgi:hypothetical protein